MFLKKYYAFEILLFLFLVGECRGTLRPSWCVSTLLISQAQLCIFLFLARWLYFFFFGSFCLFDSCFFLSHPALFLSLWFYSFSCLENYFTDKKPTSNQNKSNQIKTKLVKLVIFVFALRKANNLISPINYHCCFNFTVVTTVLQII